MANKSFRIPVIGSDQKSIDFDPWGGIDGFLSATSGSTDNAPQLRKIVPWLNKAVVFTANAVSQLPYVLTRGDDEIDPETAWGGVANPQTLLYKVAASLCGGAAYVLPDVTSRAIIDLRYLAPSTIVPQFDAVTGDLRYFQRSYNGKTENIQPEDMLYFWLPDDSVEIGAAKITPLANATLAAGLLAAMDASLKVYGERGFIPPMILSAKGMPNKAEAEKTEKWWNAFLRGWTKTVAKIINADAMTPTAIGAGMRELQNSYIQITRQQIENIGAAFGIPSGIFMSDSAYATEMESLIEVWYTSGTFVTLYQTVEDTLNQQLWARFGIKGKFDLQQVKAFQKEENDKSGSLSTLAATFTQYPEASVTAAGVLGYDMTDEQIAEIRALKPKEEETPEPEDTEDDSMELPSDEENAIAEEITKWRAFAEKPRKREFDTKHIPPAMAERIRAGLREANGDPQKITAVFDNAVKGNINVVVQDDTALKALAASIEAAVMKAEPVQPTINVTMPNITLTAQMPQGETPQVVVNVPEQPAPSVTVKNDVPVPSVTVNSPVENNVTVQPANVVFPELPSEAEITTERNGTKKLKVKK